MQNRFGAKQNSVFLLSLFQNRILFFLVLKTWCGKKRSYGVEIQIYNNNNKTTYSVSSIISRTFSFEYKRVPMKNAYFRVRLTIEFSIRIFSRTGNFSLNKNITVFFTIKFVVPFAIKYEVRSSLMRLNNVLQGKFGKVAIKKQKQTVAVVFETAFSDSNSLRLTFECGLQSNFQLEFLAATLSKQKFKNISTRLLIELTL